MLWVDPIDKVPQIPQDWANHALYGALLGAVSAAVYGVMVHPGVAKAWLFGAIIVLGVTAIKKVVDYFMEAESVAMCVGKTFFTALLPFCFYTNSFL